jgi:hypothetical protein
MERPHVLPAAVLALACAGCAGVSPTGMPLSGGSAADPCKGANCEVTFTAIDCQHPENTTVDLNTIYVEKSNKPLMRWTIPHLLWIWGYEFADANGIVFKSAIQGEFEPQSQGAGPRTRLFRNNHSDKPQPITYEYGINLVRRLGSTGTYEICKQKDPFVVNL